MAPHSSTLAWKIPWMEKPGGLQSMGSLGVWHDWVTSPSLFTLMHWRRKWKPTPGFLPGDPATAEPGGLLSMGSHRVGRDWSDLAAAAGYTCFHLRNLTSAALPDLPLHILTLEARSSHSVCIHGECQAISKIFFVVTWSIYFCFIGYTKAFDCVDHNKLWKILKEMAIPDHLTCLLRNLYAGQETTVATGHGTTDLFQIGKGVPQGYKLSPCLSNLSAGYVMRNADVLDGWSAGWNQGWLEKYQQPQRCRWHHPYGRRWRRTKEPLYERKRVEWKCWLKTQHSEN